MRSSKKALGVIGLLTLAFLGTAQTPRPIKVIIDSAIIRSLPALDAEILDVVSKGTVLEVIEKAGPWYKVRSGKDEIGEAVYGYIHETMVELGGEAPAASPARSEPRTDPQPGFIPPLQPREVQMPAPPPGEVTNTQVKVRSRDKLIAGSFLRYGFNDHWVASFGHDFGVGRHAGIGLEFQPYFENLSEAGRSTIQMDIFLNLKLGFKLWVFTLYGGGGSGPDLLYTSTETEGHSSARFKTRFAYHGIAGVVINVGKVAFVFEYQPIWISDPDVKPDVRSQFYLIGLRF